MSYYDCLDAIEKRQLQLAGAVRFFSSKTQCLKEKIFLDELKQELEQRLRNKDFSGLESLLIKTVKFNQSINNKYYALIIADLTVMNSRLKRLRQWHTSQDTVQRRLKQTPPHARTPLQNKNINYYITNHLAGFTDQSNPFLSFQLGNNGGVCFGLVYALARNISEIRESDELFYLQYDKLVHCNQKNQKKWQHNFSHQRLGVRKFCANPRKQIAAIYQLALAHKNQHLLITVNGAVSLGAHSLYLRVEDNRILFMDPNWGIFEFCDKEDLFQCYCECFVKGMKFYAVTKFTFLTQGNETKSLSGIFRSAMTGAKYTGYIPSKVEIAAYILVLGVIITLSVISLTTTALPLIISLFVSLALLSLIGLRAFAMFETQHDGLLNIPHLLMKKYSDLRGEYNPDSEQHVNRINLLDTDISPLPHECGLIV